MSKPPSYSSAGSYFKSIEEYIAVFKKYGDPGERYIRSTYPRMCLTKRMALEGMSDARNLRLLDIGAHWLHNSLLYAIEGISVTAAELSGNGTVPVNPVVSGIAEEFGIELVSYKELSNPVELNGLPAGSFDLILFTEVLEHITFNPVHMWEALHRLLDSNGKIILTTPNYHFASSIARELIRQLAGRSSGIPVEQIIGLHTYGHHWKLFSAKDIKKYFQLLSPDFSVEKVRYFNYEPSNKPSLLKKIKKVVEKNIKYFREALYVEIRLKGKNNGIVAKPAWFMN
mgnify:CR=1 FL=1